jgi:hypothetical protein
VRTTITETNRIQFVATIENVSDRVELVRDCISWTSRTWRFSGMDSHCLARVIGSVIDDSIVLSVRLRGGWKFSLSEHRMRVRESASICDAYSLSDFPIKHH